MIDLSVYNSGGKEVDVLKVDESVFGGSVRYPLLKQAIVMYHANKRIGTANTFAAAAKTVALTVVNQRLVANYLDKFGIESGATVLDPFVGTGTTLVECKKRGVHSIGIDANPVTAFASRVKTQWDIDLDSFCRRRDEFLPRPVYAR